MYRGKGYQTLGKRPQKTTEQLVRAYIATTERFRRLSAEEEAEIVRRWQQGDMARQERTNPLQS